MLRRALALSVISILTVALLPAAGASEGRAGRYIVVLRDSVDDPRSVAREHARSQGATVGHIYQHALKGYSATMSDVAAQRLAGDPRVDYIEADGIVHKSQTTPPVPWGLDRIDQEFLPLSGSYTYGATGAGVRAYVIDSGVTQHDDFAGRLAEGTGVMDAEKTSADCDGHGTHVAGTIGGTTYGVAKSVTLVPVRVLDCNGSGTWSGVIAGVDWVTQDHKAKVLAAGAAGAPAVANMSLSGGYSASVNDAVTNSIAAGVTYAVAAGNGDQAGKAQDACGRSPASTPAALTIGATNSSDAKASWSNYGTCLDLFAPGVSITSTTMSGGTASWSGTSMATPHVAGVAALYLQGSPAAAPAEVVKAITDQATAGVVTGEGTGSPDLLLYSNLSRISYTSPPSPTLLTARAYKVKNSQRVDLTWSGDGAVANVDIVRNGGRVTPTSNDGAYTDSVPRGAGTYTYKVCNAGTASCSNELTVTF